MGSSKIIAIFSGLPIPPPDNNLYINLNFRGRGGRVKSSGYKVYMREFEIWELEHHLHLLEVRKALESTKELGIEIEFKFSRKSLYCLDGRIKRMDLTNRLKAFMDCLSKAIGVDDSYFFEVTCKKIITEAQPSVSVVLKVI